jgi:hypothetical protein
MARDNKAPRWQENQGDRDRTFRGAHSVTTSADTLTPEAAVDLAKQAIDAGGMT